MYAYINTYTHIHAHIHMYVCLFPFLCVYGSCFIQLWFEFIYKGSFHFL